MIIIHYTHILSRIHTPMSLYVKRCAVIVRTMQKYYAIFFLYLTLFVIGASLSRGASFERRPTTYFYAFPTITNFERKDTYTMVLGEEGVLPTYSYEKASLVILHKFDDIHKLHGVKKMRQQCVMGIKSIDEFASKAKLASIFGKPFPQHVPKTWVFSRTDDLTDLRRQFDVNGAPLFPMILKKDVQRQTGLSFVKHVSDIEEAHQYVVCQKMLTNPLLVNNRKINLRLYLLVACTHLTEMYMFNDGFLYYAPEPYDQTVSFKTHVTTGYVDRSIYDTNPLTLQELYAHVGSTNAIILQRNIRTLMTDLCRAYSPVVTATDGNRVGNRHFVILGVDIAPDSDYGVTIMEINKGPDLNEKDKRDGRLKRMVVRDALAICDVIPKGSKNNYTKLI